MTFSFYDLATGEVVATHPFDDPMDAYAYRQRLQRQTGRELSSLVPTRDPETDAAHIRLMVDCHRVRQEVRA